MHSSKGKPLSPEVKRVTVKVKEYFDRNKKTFGISESSIQITADVIGIGLASVQRILADYNKDPALLDRPPQAKGRPNRMLDSSIESLVRSYIREANKNGQHITLEMIKEFILEFESETDFHVATLGRSLDRWGFTFGKGTRSQHLKEKDHVIAARQRYLRKKIANRDGDACIRPEVYLDESYVNKNHSSDLIWYFDDDGPWVQKPTGKGERLIILNAITSEGWVPNAKMVFKSSRKTGDYHGQMNAGLFQKWFKEHLLPNIPSKSLIILDNATYHNALASCSAPQQNSTKIEIRTWLEKNKIPCSQDCVKAELIEILKKLAPEPTYELDEIANKQGHEILRTPPYHPELQPIEICWGIVKNHVARHSDFTMATLQNNLDDGFQKVTSSTCMKLIKKIREIEDEFWENESKIDEIE